MKKIRYSLKFVNNGDPFLIPNWTSEKHESALAKLAKDTKGMSDEKTNKEFKFYVVHETLLTIDPECKMEDIKNMHAVNLVEIFNAVYDAGREDIYFVDFQAAGKTRLKKKSKKSIGPKS